MAANTNMPVVDYDDKKVLGSTSPDIEPGTELRNPDGSSIKGGEDVLALQDLDPALNMKMHLVNNVSDSGPLRRRPRELATCRFPDPWYFLRDLLLSAMLASPFLLLWLSC